MSEQRIWEPFLTPRDRIVLGQSRRVERHMPGPSSRPALLLIDFYRAAFGSSPVDLPEALRDWPSSCGVAAWDTLPVVKRLLAAARRANFPVVYTTGIVESGIAGQHDHRAEPDPAHPEGWHSPAEIYEILPEIGPIPGDAVIRKKSSSAMWGTPLVGHLIQHKVDTLIICGESTSGCVRATVVDADSYRFNVLLVEDATFDRVQATHAMNLFDMDRKFAHVLSSDSVIEWMATVEPGS